MSSPERPSAVETFVRRVRTLNLLHQGVPPARVNLQRDLLVRPKGAPSPEPDGRHRRQCFNTFAKESSYYARYNAHTGEAISWQFSALMAGSDSSMDPQAATAVATQAAQPPPDAVLERAEYETQGGVATFVVTWKHVHAGLPVERDRIEVRVNGRTGKVFSVYRFWHQVDERPTLR